MVIEGPASDSPQAKVPALDPTKNQYQRLLAALCLSIQHAHLTKLTEIMPGSRMALWSDCFRRGFLTPRALKYAGAIGINLNYLILGKDPMYQYGYSTPAKAGQAPVKIKDTAEESPERNCLIFITVNGLNIYAAQPT